ncbi:MAG: tRNA pseudouridine(38-40) synthase TruA [bacterium]|nr:tRNA pseudouridine(38-40) synthase TruA [bacterium]
MRRILCKVEYYGALLVGWQRQPNGRSAQGEIEKALTQIAGHHIGVVAPSRTDSGVHAKGQVCSFDWPQDTPLSRLYVGLNALLPGDVAIRQLVEVPLGFKVKENYSKIYSYKLFEAHYLGVFERWTHWWMPRPLDLDAMRAGAEILKGQHNFNAFRAKGCQAPQPIKTIERFELQTRKLRDGLEMEFTVQGDGFMRHMVRIMVGNLVEIGQGKRDLAGLASALESGKRRSLGQTAPPHGLTLESILYDPDPFSNPPLGATAKGR